jgi:V/A-type H+/Na+-transporting ATPase subunit D
MSEIKLTKNELRAQQVRLAQLNKYLPTLQLKKAMLQLQVNEAKIEIEKQKLALNEKKQIVLQFASLLTINLPFSIHQISQIEKIEKKYENIAGVEVPSLINVKFTSIDYSLFLTPPWLDNAIEKIHFMVKEKVAVLVSEEKKYALEKELREVSIRVNLFEKILIPRSIANIKKIKVFLGDQQLGAVSQAKVAKGKIIAKKEALKGEIVCELT